MVESIYLKDVIKSSNTGLDAVKRAPILNEITDLRCLRIGDVSNNRRFQEWGYTRVSEVDYNKFKLLKNDLIIARTGNTIGVNKIILANNLKSVFNNGLIRLRANEEKAFPKFIYYTMQQKEFKNFIESIAFGTSTQPNMKIQDLLNFKIPNFRLETQEKIASILSALDDKIEINNEMNKTLEEMAQTLFKRWFIDFDFPNENGEPYRSSGGKMVDSELGEIPEGWEVGNFENIGIIASGGTPSKSNEEYYTKNGIPWITPKDLSLNKNKFITKGSLDITEKGLAKSSTKLLPKGTVLFSSRAPIGYLAIAEVNVTTNQGFKSIIPNNSENTEFIYQLLKEITPHIESIAGGSTFKEISSQGMKSINITIPSDLILKKYFEITESFNKKIQNLEKEIQSLTEIRDTLLPKLMSGEIEV